MQRALGWGAACPKSCLPTWSSPHVWHFNPSTPAWKQSRRRGMQSGYAVWQVSPALLEEGCSQSWRRSQRSISDLGLHVQQDLGLSFSILCYSGKSFLKQQQGGAPLTTLGDSHLHDMSSPSQSTVQRCPPQTTALGTSLSSQVSKPGHQALLPFSAVYIQHPSIKCNPVKEGQNPGLFPA